MKRVLAEALIIAGGIVLGGMAVVYGLPLVQPRYEAYDSQALPMGITIASALESNPPAGPLAALYQQRDWRPLWVESNGKLSADATQVQAIIAAAADQGLPAGHYRLPPMPAANNDPQAMARYDLALSETVLKYAQDMAQGVLKPGALFDDAESALVPDPNLPQALVAAAGAGNAAAFLAGLEPQGDYQRLKAALKFYRSGEAWPEVALPKTGKSTLPRIVQAKAPARSDVPADSVPPDTLAERLRAETWLAADRADPAAVTEALIEFQTANGLEAKGRLDKDTVAALNIPRATRAAQIAANMERWRWLPRHFPDRYIWVNIPSAQLSLMENGKSILDSRVVVGAPDKKTPLFVTQAVAVTLNPKWHLPASIVKNEIRPKLAKDPGYLQSHNISVVDGQLVQESGPQNALGLIKFELPNEYDVYLHDTPSKKAFLSDERALSHGCVRVQAIHDLAALALGLAPESLEGQIASGDTKRKALAQPITIFFQYVTAVPLADGRTGFRDDVYNRDARMIAALQKLEV